ncbi:hypothetical protein HFN88_05280 [Rhizobium laguerreae]|uniref:hypothetical protein n=1 Tax=Rhizobium laguerreae TaxID=1076926 RepID=UPI001C913417|nr:hypothetical protein [Rhizobium laguerreae]MBY3329018.1 hypothetical protein [Rhizobium laguerreae]MBY3392096.1 hypothetical protein [Rhizobium laguerreae]
MAAVRIAAHAVGYPSIALATVLQFELWMRQKDVVGECEPADDVDQGGITYKKTRWMKGLLWSHINVKMVLRKSHTKTGFAVEHDLKLHPAVLEEIERGNREANLPVIISKATGAPYKNRKFPERWRKFAEQGRQGNKALSYLLLIDKAVRETLLSDYFSCARCRK